MRRCSISMGVADLESRCYYAAALPAQELRINRFNALPCDQHRRCLWVYYYILLYTTIYYVISTGSDCRCGVVLSSWELAFHCSTVQSTQVVQRRDIRGPLSYCRLQMLWARCLCAAYRIGQERSQTALCPRAGGSSRMARELAL
jgi:hypothetical protein